MTEGSWPLGLVLMTKHKEENFANLARAWALLEPGGTLACAGANDDGAASLEKHVAKAFGGVEQLSKFHSRVFWFAKADKEPPAYWRGLGGLQPVGDDTWLSRPGIFSWDRIDDGSALLARHLPGDIAGTVGVGIRVNPDVSANTHPYTQTGERGMKRGQQSSNGSQEIW